VPLVNPELSENMGFAHFHKPPPIDVQSAARAGWRTLVIVPHTRRSSIRKPGPPPADRCPPALSQEATEADRSRPYPVGLAMRRLERLAICFGETSVGQYMLRHRKPPSQTWRTFLNNHVKSLVSVDASTMGSSSTKPRSGELSVCTPTSIIGRELTCPWARTRQNRDRCNRRRRGES